MENSDERVRWKNDVETAIGHFGVGTRNMTWHQPVELAERKKISILTAVSEKETHKKLPGNALIETKNYTHFILTKNPHIGKIIMVTNNIKPGDHRTVSFTVGLSQRREGKLLRKKHPNISSVKEKSEEFGLEIQKKISIWATRLVMIYKKQTTSWKYEMEPAIEVEVKEPGPRGNKVP